MGFFSVKTKRKNEITMQCQNRKKKKAERKKEKVSKKLSKNDLFHLGFYFSLKSF